MHNIVPRNPCERSGFHGSNGLQAYSPVINFRVEPAQSGEHETKVIRILRFLGSSPQPQRSDPTNTPDKQGSSEHVPTHRAVGL